MRRSRLLFFIISVLTACYPAVAQTYSFRKFSEENGLPQNFIYSISQAPDRQLYCSTGEGICTFDGFNFTTITSKKLAENFVTTHHIDTRGIIWMGHNQNGISYIRNGEIHSLAVPGTSSGKVTAIIEHRSGAIYVGTEGTGIFRVDTAFRIRKVSFAPEAVHSMAFDSSGVLLAGTSSGLKPLQLSSSGLVVVKEFPVILEDKKIRQIMPLRSRSDFYWLLSEESEIHGMLLTPNGGYRAIENLIEGAHSDNFVSCIYSDKDNNLWLGSFGGGVQKLTFPEGPLQYRFHSAPLSGFSSQHVQSIYQDIEGNMWFGTLADGLIQKTAEKFVFYGKAENLPRLQVRKVLADRERLWIGTDSGLIRYDPALKLSRFFDGKNGFVSDEVSGLAFDSYGSLWVGTASSGVYVVDTAKMQFRKFEMPEGFGAPQINSLLRAANRIVASTTEGLYLIDALSGKYERMSTSEGLLHNNVRSCMYDSKGRLWLASHGAPPYYILKGKVTPLKNISGLGLFRINAYSEDQDGRIWIATDGDGLFVLEGKKVSRFTKAEGLLSDYCNGVVCSPDNAVWVTHRGGLSEKKPVSQFFNPYTEQKGLLFTENAANAADVGPAGAWFGTNNGLVNYKVNKSGSAELKPEVLLTGVSFNNRQYKADEDLNQPYGYYSVAFSYISILLGDPTAVAYKYRLLGVDSAWKTTTSRSFDFPKLGDGQYTVQIQACNRNNGLCSERPLSISFTIRPPVWKKAWFYLLLIVGVVAITYAIVMLRTRALKRTQLLLQLKVKQKTFLLQREKEAVETIKIELEHKNKDITDSINYAKRIQDSILPPEGLLASIFKDDYFVLFKPKDIVSGDFFWAAHLNANQNGKPDMQLAAVIDCTGHGVPGAFLSIMANDFLKQSVVAPGVDSPNKILDFLNENVSSHLNQSASTSKMRDGMDLALIGIDQEKKKLCYSGANNPIYIYRETNGVLDQIILTATKQAIGLVTEETVRFSSREFQLQPGDIVYLFSDGYADQFGGENNKKFSYKRFRETLAQAFPLPMDQQKELLEKTFDDWCANYDQVDDVTVMGIRIR